MAKRRGRKQRARRTLRRMGVAALVLFTVLLWPMGGMVDEAVPGEARSQVLAPEFTPEAATATAPVLTPSPEPTATPSPTATPVPEPQEITITFGGDCTLAGDVNKNNTRFQSFVEEYGYDYFLANLKPIFEADDLTIVNLEGPLTTSDDKRGGRQFNFRGDPGNAQILSAASVEAVHMANNHARDFQEEGYEDTLAAVEAVGIVPYGYAQTQVMEVKGVKIGLIGLTEWDYEPSEVREMVAQLREECDILVATFHWGEELRYTSTSTQRKFAEAAIEAGADVVVGHHPHVVSGVAEYEGVPVVFSVGNLCFGGNIRPTDMDAMLFQVHFTVDHTGAILKDDFTVIPIRVSGNSKENDYQPYVAEGDEAERILEKIEGYSLVDIR